MKIILYLFILLNILYSDENDSSIPSYCNNPQNSQEKSVCTICQLAEKYNQPDKCIQAKNNIYIPSIILNKSNQSETSKTINIDKPVIENTNNVQYFTNNSIQQKNYEVCDVFQNYLLSMTRDKGYEVGMKNFSILMNQKLMNLKKYLDIVFNLKNLYIEKNFEPPLIVADNKDIVKNNGNTYIKKQMEYRIIENAKFLKKPLKWEDFLMSEDLNKKYESQIEFDFYTNEECMNEALDKKIDEIFYEGYYDAQKEIRLLYQNRLKKLQEYMNRFFIYHRLYLSKKIEGPMITTMVTPIYSQDGSNLVISEEQYQIVKKANFNTNTKEWKNFLIKNKNYNTNYLGDK